MELPKGMGNNRGAGWQILNDETIVLNVQEYIIQIDELTNASTEDDPCMAI